MLKNLLNRNLVQFEMGFNFSIDSFKVQFQFILYVLLCILGISLLIIL